jgi:hypothetical protein
MSADVRGIAAGTALAVATPLALWLFLANPATPGELGSRLALGLSPDRYAAEMYAGQELSRRGARFFELERPSDEEAALAQRALLEARARFERGAARAESEPDRARARDAWAQADLQLARWSLARGKGRGLRNDNEDLFRWGLAYAREGLALPDVDEELRAELDEIRDRLERELTLWR